MAVVVAVAAGAVGGARAAEPVVLRMATVAPDGTAWTREMRAASREIEDETDGRLRLKWYFGAIAGDDVAVGERIAHGQLDGAASGGMLCTRAAPAMRVLRIPGVVQDRAQMTYVLARLRPIADEQFRQAGLVNLATTVLGPSVIFSRDPIRTFEDLQRTPMWRWDLDDVAITLLRAAGLHVVPLPLQAASAAYDDKRVDGFSALPAAALAFQWTSQARYFTELPMDYLAGCVVVSTRSFDALSVEDRQVLRAAVAKMAMRAEDLEQRMTEALFGSLFEKQGMHRVTPSKLFWAQYLETARDARNRLASRLVDPVLLQHVLGWLGDYYSESR